jgi:hypothetical protein
MNPMKIGSSRDPDPVDEFKNQDLKRSLNGDLLFFQNEIKEFEQMGFPLAKHKLFLNSSLLRANSGFGSPLTETREKSLGFISETAAGKEQRNYGGRCLEFIVSAQDATPISRKPMSGSLPLSDIRRSAKTADRPLLLNDSTVPSDSESRDWPGKRFLFPEN